MHARLARYTFSGNAQELAQKAEEGILPTFKSLPGFKAYTVIESDARSSRQRCRPPTKRRGEHRVRTGHENMPHIQLIESRFGEILISTTLGVSTTAGARV